MADLTKKTNDFNKKYLSKVIEGKKRPGVFKSIVGVVKAKNISSSQAYYFNKINTSKNIFQLLDLEAEMKKQDRRNFETDIKKISEE